MSENGKGSNARPFSVPLSFYKSEHERIFAKQEEVVERDPLPQDILDKLTQLSQEIGEYESVSRETTGNDKDGEDI